ncbi:hypothetical protein D9V37_16695 [Nocardioides mangrovicus]|uniref:Uncharacterized protein n=1 Tax=Nocardioides mangrovicus TaxID=2478913 RepID=A0A3L8NY59_9ACTN|nr:hypothetical protein [Nocardioides mangrovicus]RLV47771.1 hypothetical protein D9V37_16695 [Nocardioides mangrovicus]
MTLPPDDETNPTTDEQQEDLMRALQAPGTQAELADEERYRAMFRQSRPDRVDDVGEPAPVVALHSRAPRRVAIGAAAGCVIALATGGVAAAYTGSLPDPIQTFAHHVIGAPEATPETTPPTSSGAAGGATTHRPSATALTPRPTTSPSHRAGHESRPHRSHRPSATPSDVVPSPSPDPLSSPTIPVAPTGSASAGPSGSPTTSPSAGVTPVVTGVGITATAHRADVGARVRLTAQVMTSGATPNPAQRVVLEQRFDRHWARVSTAVSGADGQVTVSSLPLDRTSYFRFRSGSVHSLTWRVAMHPLLSVTTSVATKQATLVVDGDGGYPGDLVTLATRQDGELVTVARTRLAADGTVAFTVPATKQRVRYVVMLPPSRRHTASRTTVVVQRP